MTATPTALLELFSTTPGTLPVFMASEWVALAAGSPGDVLSIVGGVPGWAAPAAGGLPVTTKGDLLTYSTIAARLGVGADTYVLTADSTTATGLKWAAPSSGGVTDGDKGDVTVSSSGAVWTIDAGTVTLAKMADMATASLLGRSTAGTGVPEVLPVATARTLLGLATVATSGSASDLGAGTLPIARIAAGDVTYAKIQNVSATDRLLGRSTAGAGVIEEIALTAAGRALIDDVDAAAQRATLGLGTIATFADAPSDGSTYGRLNGAWAVAGGGSGLTHPQVQARIAFGGF